MAPRPHLPLQKNFKALAQPASLTCLTTQNAAWIASAFNYIPSELKLRSVIHCKCKRNSPL